AARRWGCLRPGGQQRADSTHVLAVVRILNRLAPVAEPLRATLNAVATVVPDCLQAVSPLAWYEHYSRRIEESQLPKAKAARGPGALPLICPAITAIPHSAARSC